MDTEILNDFVAEIKLIHKELLAIVNAQVKKMTPALFEKYGQFIDRIYGTAMTLGYTEIGKYFLAVKEICYMSSQIDNETSQKKALRMMIECVDHMDKICNAIFDKEKIKELNRLFTVEIAKVERLSKTDFANIKRKSIA